jgi:hypothetical protein
MDAGSWAALSAGVVAGAGALLGFLGNQLANRRERKSKVYAEALEAIKEYEELPYRIRRRPSSDGATRAALGNMVGEVLSKLWFYQAWIHTDSAEVGAAYSALMAQTQGSGGPFRAAAWSTPVITKDEDAHLRDQFIYDNKPELALCLLVMRRELSPWTFLLRRSTRRLLASQRQRRRGSEPSSR